MTKPSPTISAILVHAEPGGGARLQAAAQLAVRLGARLIGLGAEAIHPRPVTSPYAGVNTGEWVAEMNAQVESDLAAAQAAFESAAAGIDHEWRVRRDMPARAMAAEARSADLLVISATASRDYFRAVDPGELVLNAGRPVLLAPETDAPPQGRAIVVGWKETRESRRAVMDALPFLKAAEQVLVVGVAEDGDPGAVQSALQDVTQFLRRQGVAADLRLAEAGDVVAILNTAATEIGADLIVTGAYGQSRFREWIFGGVTRRLMDQPARWLLMSH